MELKTEAPFISEVQCASCDKIFKYKSELRVHVERIHLKLKDYLCDKCDKSFSTKAYLNDHLSTHEEKKFTCLMCGVKLSRKRILIKHMKNVHIKSAEKIKIEQPKRNNQTPIPEKFPCHLCGKLFSYNRTLRKHIRKHDVGRKKTREKFSNEFKLEVLEKAKEIGVAAAKKTFGLKGNMIKG